MLILSTSICLCIYVWEQHFQFSQTQHSLLAHSIPCLPFHANQYSSSLLIHFCGGRPLHNIPFTSALTHASQGYAQSLTFCVQTVIHLPTIQSTLFAVTLIPNSHEHLYYFLHPYICIPFVRATNHKTIYSLFC